MSTFYVFYLCSMVYLQLLRLFDFVMIMTAGTALDIRTNLEVLTMLEVQTRNNTINDFWTF